MGEPKEHSRYRGQADRGPRQGAYHRAGTGSRARRARGRYRLHRVEARGKLSEELSSDGELKPTQFAKILSEPNAAVRPETCDAITSSIEAACEANDVNLLVKVLSDPAVGLQLDDSAMAIKAQN